MFLFNLSLGCSYYYITVKVFHYGFFENLGGKFEPTLEKGKEVSLFVDQPRRKLNSRFKFLQTMKFFNLFSSMCDYYTVYKKNFNSASVNLILFWFFHLCRLHSAGHLLDICLPRIGLGNLEPSKAYHFPDGYIIFLFLNLFMRLIWIGWVLKVIYLISKLTGNVVFIKSLLM